MRPREWNLLICTSPRGKFVALEKDTCREMVNIPMADHLRECVRTFRRPNDAGAAVCISKTHVFNFMNFDRLQDIARPIGSAETDFCACVGWILCLCDVFCACVGRHRRKLHDTGTGLITQVQLYNGNPNFGQNNRQMIWKGGIRVG